MTTAYQYDGEYAELSETSDSSLLDLLDRILEHGVVLVGDIRISVANVDLLFVGLKAIICSIEKAEQYRASHILVKDEGDA